MPMRLTVGTHYAGQTSWWLNGHNNTVVAATAEFEVAMYWTGENAANTVVVTVQPPRRLPGVVSADGQPHGRSDLLADQRRVRV